jgi:hypothetical protein
VAVTGGAADAVASRHDPGRRVLAEVEFGARAVQHAQPFARVGQAHAAAAAVGETDPGVGHLHHQLRAFAPGGQIDAAAAAGRLQAVLDRILQQRADHGRWELGFQKVGRRVNRECQPFSHAELHDRQERVCQLEFAAERGAGAAHRRHRAAQVVDQMREHLLGGRRVLAREHLHVGQRVVEEVRLDLRLQHAQARGQHFALQHQRALAGLGLAALALQHQAE